VPQNEIPETTITTEITIGLTEVDIADITEETIQELTESVDNVDNIEDIIAEMTYETEMWKIRGVDINNDDFKRLRNAIESYGNSISVFYNDITDGQFFMYNAGSQYYIASVLKVPYAMHLYRLALDNQIDINERIGYQNSVEELIGYSISLSDNIAYQMLVTRFGYAQFRQYFEEQGLSGMSAEPGLRSMICIECTAFYLEKIYEFVEENNEYSSFLKQHMIDSQVQLLTLNGSVLRKYGFDGRYLHEIAIVYDDGRTYLFALLTNGHSDNYIEIFGQISNIIEEYNEYLKRRF
jgi:hypothetical protein